MLLTLRVTLFTPNGRLASAVTSGAWLCKHLRKRSHLNLLVNLPLAIALSTLLQARKAQAGECDVEILGETLVRIVEWDEDFVVVILTTDGTIEPATEHLSEDVSRKTTRHATSLGHLWTVGITKLV
jgi:hypothetical protein